MSKTQKIILALFLTLLTVTGSVWIPLSYRWIESYFQFTGGYMFAPFMMLTLTAMGLVAATIASWASACD